MNNIDTHESETADCAPLAASTGYAENGCYAIPRAVNARKLRCEINGTEYKWVGGFGAVIESVERGVSDGDVRCIGGVLFHASLSLPEKWGRKRICWTIPNDRISPEWIRAFRAAVFSA